nr:putative nucleotidyltransferase, ribonuclease H [Tanacetum cinerariifolium]
MIAGIKVDEEIIRDLERLDIELYVRRQHGYWASQRVELDLIFRIKEAQKEESEIWTITDDQSERTIQTLEDMLRSCALEKSRAPICWDQVGERVIEGPEMIEVTNKKVAVAKEKLKEVVLVRRVMLISIINH